MQKEIKERFQAAQTKLQSLKKHLDLDKKRAQAEKLKIASQ